MITLINRSTIRMPRQFIEQWLTFTICALQTKKEGSQQVEMTVVFLDVPEAKRINRTYRKKNYATDILSFESENSYGVSPIDWGELLICPAVLKKQAKLHGHSFNAELGYMLIHGVLHLLGHDHEKSKQEAARMFQIQDQLFDRLCTKFEI